MKFGLLLTILTAFIVSQVFLKYEYNVVLLIPICLLIGYLGYLIDRNKND